MPVVSVGDARPAVEGRDYELVTSYPARDVGGTDERSVVGVTADGLLVVLDGPRSGGATSRVGLLDPTTDRTSRLPGARRLGVARVRPGTGVDSRGASWTMTTRRG